MSGAAPSARMAETRSPQDVEAHYFLFHAMRATCLIGMAAVLAACTQRIVKPDDLTAPVRLDWTSTTSDSAHSGVELMLRYRVVTNGPGSWTRDAPWDEYALVIRNSGASPVEVTGIELEGDNIPTVMHAARSEELEAGTRRNIAVLAALGTGGLVVGAVAVPYALTAGSFGALSTAAVVAPVGIVVGGVTLIGAAHSGKQRQMVDYQLARKTLSLPVTCEAGMQAQGSAFFPVHPFPRLLRIRYATPSGPRVTELDVSALAARVTPPVAPAAGADNADRRN